MTDATDPRLLRRFLNTVRVATATALAEYELTVGRAAGAAPAVFRALAAKVADGWRFPAEGLESADGLVHAALERDAAGAPDRLVLQARGSAGLAAYADRRLRLSFGPLLPEAVAGFGPDGRAVVPLAGLGLDEDELSAFVLSPDGGE
jgi:hypothetical protein